ncbi:MAG TPA: hypothetical protein VJ722_03710 [Rhodanobacteraceae bacterium]|nr:hypothetical protein [Rhodanobacteraceae bacterium]
MQAAQQTGGACNLTTELALDSCQSGASADFRLALGVCTNDSNPAERQRCIRQAQRGRDDALESCTAQHAYRQAVCRGLGPTAYDPPIDPADFTTDIDNPWFPLKPGTTFVYKAGDHALIRTSVTHDTITIAGVKCVVVHDEQSTDGIVEENTYDYYAQDRSGNVWYFGEDTAEYTHGFPTSVEGAWRAGVAGAKPGIAMHAPPVPGELYRQEFALGVAEDMAKVTGFHQPVHVPYGDFNALKTFEFTPLEPGAKENKYYAFGIGQVLSVDLVTGDREELIRIEQH